MKSGTCTVHVHVTFEWVYCINHQIRTHVNKFKYVVKIMHKIQFEWKVVLVNQSDRKCYFSIRYTFSFFCIIIPHILALLDFSHWHFLSLSNIRLSKVERQWQEKSLKEDISKALSVSVFGFKYVPEYSGNASTAYEQHTQTHTHALGVSMWCCLDGLRAAYLSVCDRLTAQAPSTLSTIIKSRNRHTWTYTHKGHNRLFNIQTQNLDS